jgi:hypothetical protein
MLRASKKRVSDAYWDRKSNPKFAKLVERDTISENEYTQYSKICR